jgi:hypothetical protein
MSSDAASGQGQGAADTIAGRRAESALLRQDLLVTYDAKDEVERRLCGLMAAASSEVEHLRRVQAGLLENAFVVSLIDTWCNTPKPSRKMKEVPHRWMTDEVSYQARIELMLLESRVSRSRLRDAVTAGNWSAIEALEDRIAACERRWRTAQAQLCRHKEVVLRIDRARAQRSDAGRLLP